MVSRVGAQLTKTDQRLLESTREVHMPARDIVDLLLTLGAVAPTTGDSNGTESVSLVQLIANPDKFDDKPVLVMGFLRLEYEGNATYFR